MWAPKDDQGGDVCPREGREQEALDAQEEGEAGFGEQRRETEAKCSSVILVDLQDRVRVLSPRRGLL